jgi:hypothetical protein
LERIFRDLAADFQLHVDSLVGSNAGIDAQHYFPTRHSRHHSDGEISLSDLRIGWRIEDVRVARRRIQRVSGTAGLNDSAFVAAVDQSYVPRHQAKDRLSRTGGNIRESSPNVI